MKRISKKTQWILSVAAVVALGGAVAGGAAARAVTQRPAPSYGARDLPMPALDRVIAKLAADARARTIALDTYDLHGDTRAANR